MLHIPSCAEEFTADWLNDALSPLLNDAEVMDCRVVDSDIPGQTADIVLLDVEYNREIDLPSRMVAKISSSDPEIISGLIVHFDQYYRETSFYREFAESGISTPRCLYQDFARDGQSFVLLMADLAPSTCPSWGISAEQVEFALSRLPSLHGKWWGDSTLLSRDYLVRPTDMNFYGALFGAAHAAAPILHELYEDPTRVTEMMAAAASKPESVTAHVASRPCTLIHGDYHAKQMFFPSDEGGEFAVIDWQFPMVAQGAWDFARMLNMGLPTELRRAEEPRLLREYLAGLKSAGVQNYTLEDLELDYRFGIYFGLCVMTVASADTDVSILEKECSDLGVDWKDVMFCRLQRAMEDWNTDELIKSL